MNKYMKKVLKKMCKMVHANYDEIDFKAVNWFYEYSWSREDEAKFTIWLARYLKRSKKARRCIMRYPDTKKYTDAAQDFTNNCGWKTRG